MGSDRITILYRDEFLVAVHKPAGLLVHRTDLDRRETEFALQQTREAVGRHVFPIHRLDRPTSGLLLFALSSEAAAPLREAFDTGRVEKRYLAVVRGIIPSEGVIDHPVTEEDDRYAGREGRERDAVTGFRRLATAELPFAVGRHATARYSLVEAVPETGRRHQIRRHFKHLFHPVIGDTTYGDGRHNRFFRDELGSARLLLASTALILPHPATGETIRLEAPLAPDFLSVVNRLGWRNVLPPHLAGEEGT